MMTAMECYKELESKLGAEERVTPTITKRSCTEDGWTYDFLFYKGKLSKVEAHNHREFIECYA